MTQKKESHSTFLNLLPLPFRAKLDFISEAYWDKDNFTGRFLKIFESILTGDEALQIPGEKQHAIKSIAKILDAVPDYACPDCVPRSVLDGDFGTWFMGRLGLEFTDTWTYYQKKQMIKNIIPIYRMRGTRIGLQAFISIYTGYEAEVYEILGIYGIGYYRAPVNSVDGLENLDPPNPKIIRRTRIGRDTVIGGKMVPNLFIINATIESCREKDAQGTDSLKLKQKIDNLKRQIESEKPVYTYYQLTIKMTMLQVGARGSCTIGVNTILRENNMIVETANSWDANNNTSVKHTNIESTDASPEPSGIKRGENRAK